MPSLNHHLAALAEQNVLSIRLTLGGLTFMHRATVDGTLVEVVCPLPKGFSSVTEAVQDIIFRHDDLSLPFQRIDFYYEPHSWVIVPADLYQENKGHLWVESVSDAPTNDIGQSMQSAALSYAMPQDGRVMVLSYDKDLVAFLRRTLIPLSFVPYFAQHLGLLSDLSRQHNCTTLSLVLRENKADYFAYKNGVAQCANTFTYTPGINAAELADELVFYVFTTWNSLQLSNEDDLLIINHPTCATPEIVGIDLAEVSNQLKTYLTDHIRHINVETYSVLPK